MCITNLQRYQKWLYLKATSTFMMSVNAILFGK